MAVFRNRYWSFRIEQKVFVLHLLRDGGGIRISERTRFRSFDMELDVPAAVWCMETLQEVLHGDFNKGFFRKYRGSNSVLLIERFSSRKGAFVKLVKLVNGGLQNIIIPGGINKWGWRRRNFAWIILWEKGSGGLKGAEVKRDLHGLDTVIMRGCIRTEDFSFRSNLFHIGVQRVE